ncbi:uncharacterized protein LOC127520858 [Ctenopharyngodon idella]|uniref:uncharacterized protein LOC127520858 n=1 Tax=Ctenopharyngodon idella TaxID=7959 RepID=UPI002231D3A7|nr:uncharacterized protein LOC127520858 [Ctenopharyngodon idella]
MKDDDVIQWRFGNENSLIAEINKRADRIAVYDDVPDGRFWNRLKLDKQTGSLTITNIRTELSGLYKLQINSVIKSFSLTVIGLLSFTRPRKSVSVKEGDSVIFRIDFLKILDNDVIQWRFKNTLIAEINKRADRITVNDDVLDGRFRDRLKLDNQTGSLTITNTRTEHAGVYLLQIHHTRVDFYLTVYNEVSVKKGDSVTLNSGLTEMKDDDVIQWRFGYNNTLIAEINKRFNSFTVYDDVLDGRFRDRLKLNNQTGSLTITNITTEHGGVYELQINSVRKRFLLTVYCELNIGLIYFIYCSIEVNLKKYQITFND